MLKSADLTKMAGHSFPVSLGLPRWRPCQIPDPGATLKCQNPYPGEGTLSQFPVGSPPPPPPPPPWGLTLIGAKHKGKASASRVLSCTIKLRLCVNDTLGRLYYFCTTPWLWRPGQFPSTLNSAKTVPDGVEN